MTYDPISRGVVLFGGTSGDAKDAEPRSLWSWDGARWRCLSSDGPPGRDAPELAFDAERRKLVLYGGRTRGADRQLRVLTDTWEWDGTRWSQIDTVGPTPRRLHQVLGYDPSRRAVILHGGLNTDDRGRPLSDTWRWTGVRWEEVPLATPPANAENHNALMSSGDGVILLMQVKDSTRCPPSGRWQRAQAKVFELRGAGVDRAHVRWSVRQRIAASRAHSDRTRARQWERSGLAMAERGVAVARQDVAARRVDADDAPCGARRVRSRASTRRLLRR